MKVLALLLLFPLFGLDTSDFKPNESRRFNLGDSVNVTITRQGEVRTVTVERHGVTNGYTIAPVDGELRVTGRSTSGKPIDVGVMVDGVMLGPTDIILPRPDRDEARFYICSVDETMVRVKPGKSAVGELRCPLDGTVMHRAVGRSQKYFLLQ